MIAVTLGGACYVARLPEVRVRLEWQ